MQSLHPRMVARINLRMRARIITLARSLSALILTNRHTSPFDTKTEAVKSKPKSAIAYPRTVRDFSTNQSMVAKNSNADELSAEQKAALTMMKKRYRLSEIQRMTLREKVIRR